MAFSFVFGLLLCVAALVSCIDPEYHPEAPCNGQGGICTLATNCPHKIETKNLGLCPEQKSKGAECCNEIPKQLVHICKSYGGECTKECPTTIRQAEATDCPIGEHCCVYRN